MMLVRFYEQVEDSAIAKPEFLDWDTIRYHIDLR